MTYTSAELTAESAHAANHLLTRLRAANAVPAVDEGLLRLVLASSEFIANALLADPELVAAPDVVFSEPFGHLERITDEALFMAELRRVRRRELARIAWRDLTGQAELVSTLCQLSALADGALRAAHAYASQSLQARFGVPRNTDGVIQNLVIVAMGKLGGGELNFSSDIDLIFMYPDSGVTDGARELDNFEYFTRLGKKLIQLLDAVTSDGFVYRVDMRLRPFGDSGPLVSSFAAIEDYLLEHGREWERYAWVKARAVTGLTEYDEVFNNVIRPFVFRRYLDFGIFESLREMKALIAREVQRRDLEDNIKLGRGGIREIEFIVQALQLVRGGSDARLRAQSLLVCLPLLAGKKLLPSNAVADLLNAYTFLRRLENRLQMYLDEQTHQLPQSESRRASVVTAMGMNSWQQLCEALDWHRVVVSNLFSILVLAAQTEAPVITLEFESAFEGARDSTELIQVLSPIASSYRAEIAQLLLDLKKSVYYQRLDEAGRRRLHGLLSRICVLLNSDNPSLTLRRIFAIIEAIGTRTSYLSLLNENPLALQRLVNICDVGKFLADQIAAFPLLLDELVDRRLFDAEPSRSQLSEELTLRCDAGSYDDEERDIDLLRQFQRAALFRVALFDLTGRMPLMRVSDRLTDIAELILEQAMTQAWGAITKQYGEPLCGAGSARRVCAVAAVGYGKLGGRELGYVSDLDLVFIHDSKGETQETSGPKVIENAVFFVRLAQKIVHILSVYTAAGRLYEVDMRLRPSGKGGMSITQLDAFIDYQRTEAWTWEHQALLHSRAIAGSMPLRTQFEAARVALLCSSVRYDTLQADVRHMRERMRRELSSAQDGAFDIKQDAGGVADIEFLAQFWVLRWAASHPPLVTYSDTIRQLESVGSIGLVDHATIDTLVETYQFYRQLTHRLSLDGQKAVVLAGPYAARRAAVSAIWNAHFS